MARDTGIKAAAGPGRGTGNKPRGTIGPAAGSVDRSKMGELRQRLLFVVGAIIVFRIGSFISIPGINPDALAQFFEAQQGTILALLGTFTGGALERFGIFALGIMPYISASIIMQLLTYVMPSMEALKKEGESGRRKITQYTRYGTVGLATFQAIGALIGIAGQANMIIPGVGYYQFLFTGVITLVTGTVFLMWLGEQITERGIGNGISLLIFAGIVAGLPSAIAGTLELVNNGTMNPLIVVALFAIVLLVTAFVVFVERGQRRITVNYARRQVGRKVYGGQSSHLPLKMNMSGVIPPIFASSLILFPVTIASWFGQSDGMEWLQGVAAAISPGQPLYILIYALLIMFFCFFYTALVFNSRETADNLKKSGAFVPGIRPGEQTANYIDNVLTKLTIAGALYITLVCLLPEFMIVGWNVPFYFGGTSLLIIVIVVMDFMAQLQAHLMSHQYDGLMKKANLNNEKA